MSNSGDDSHGSRFLITTRPTPQLQAVHERKSGNTVFGRVVSGQEIVEQLDRSDVVCKATVLAKRDHEYRPKVLLAVAAPVHPTLLESGRFDEARREAQTEWDGLRTRLGERHIDTLQAGNRLGMVLLKQGDYRAARQRFEENLAGLQAKLGEQHALTAQAWNNLGVVWHRLGNFSKAREHLEPGHRIRLTLLGPADDATIQSEINLALVLKDLDDTVKAASLLEEAGKLLEKNLDRELTDRGERSADVLELRRAQPRHPVLISSFASAAPFPAPPKPFTSAKPLDTAYKLSLLGIVQSERNQYQADDTFEKALTLRSRALGREHLLTAMSLNNWAVQQLNGSTSMVSSFGPPSRLPPLKHAAQVIQRTAGDQHPWNLRSASNLAIALLEAKLDNEARQHLRELPKLAAKLLDEPHPETADVLELVGLADHEAGENHSAQEWLVKAAELRRKIFGDDHPRTTVVWNTCGIVAYHRGEFSTARARLETTLAARSKRFGANHLDTTKTLNDLGIVLKAQGDYPNARRALEAAIAPFKTNRGSTGFPSIAETNLQVLLIEMGDSSGAREFFEKQLTPDKPNQVRVAALVSLGSLARTAGDRDAAQKFFEQALAISPQETVALNSLGAIARERGDWQTAQQHFESVLLLQRKKNGPAHPNVAWTLTSMGLLAQQRGNYDEAVRLFDEAMTITSNVYGEQHRRASDLRRMLGETKMLAGQDAAARQDLEAALAGKLRFANDVLPTLSEAEALAFVTTLGERDTLLSLYRRIEDVTPRQAYEAVWQTRSIATRAIQARRQLVGADAQVQSVWDKLRRVRSEFSTLTNAEPKVFSKPDELALKRQQRLVELSREKEVLERSLAELSTPFRQQNAERNATPDDLCRALPNETAVVDFVKVRVPRPGERDPSLTPEFEYHAFVLPPHRASENTPVTWLRLGSAQQIEEAVDQWRTQVSQGLGGGDRGFRSAKPNVAATADRPQQTLREKLWAPLEPHLTKIKSVLIIPDGALTRLPWGALPGREDGRFLIEDYAISTANHGQQVLSLLRQDRPTAGQQLLVGGITYDRVANPANSVSREGNVDWSYLPGTLDETRQIATIASPATERKQFEKLSAEKGALATHLPRSRFVHLATHGFFADPAVRSAFQSSSPNSIVELDEARLSDSERPGVRLPSILTVPMLQSVTGRNPLVLCGLVLAGANSPPPNDAFGMPIGDDGILTGEEVANLDLGSTELVVLSACETGLGQVAGGEGVFGLQRAFGLAGARTVLASLWKVDDRATQALMIEFYRNLWQKKLSRAESLRQAQLTLMHAKDLDTAESSSAKPQRNAPYFWAAFSLSGDWR